MLVRTSRYLNTNYSTQRRLVKFFNGSVSLKKNKNTLNDTENVANNINIKILKFLNDQKI